MFAAGPEKNRHKKRDDGAETDPPWKCQYRKPTRLLVELRAENTGDAIGQSAQDGDDGKANDHGNDVAAIVPARPG